MKALRRTTAAAIALTFGLIVLGAWVRATGSGLSCPDWPTCYGHWLPLPGEIPPAAGYSYFQVMLEWVHRLLAGVILGPLILAIGALAWRVRAERPRMPAYGGALVLLLLVQAGLGGVTVLDQNSPWSVALHLTTALILFSVLWLIHARARPARPGDAPAGSVPALAAATWLLALGAMASAAVMTKSGASLACASWPLCNAAPIPDLGDPEIRINVIHRLLAAGAALGSVLLFLRLRGRPGLGVLAGQALALMVVEVGLGGLVVALAVPMWSGLLHQGLGVLAFGLLSLLMWRAQEVGPEPGRKPAHVGLSRA